MFSAPNNIHDAWHLVNIERYYPSPPAPQTTYVMPCIWSTSSVPPPPPAPSTPYPLNNVHDAWHFVNMQRCWICWQGHDALVACQPKTTRENHKHKTLCKTTTFSQSCRFFFLFFFLKLLGLMDDLSRVFACNYQNIAKAVSFPFSTISVMQITNGIRSALNVVLMIKKKKKKNT